MFNNKQMKSIETALNGSELFKRINESCKRIYAEQGIEHSKEEYEALRGVIIAKTILDDPNVFKMVSNMVCESLNN